MNYDPANLLKQPQDAASLLDPQQQPSSFRWATVTSTSPLRIRLDQSPHPLDATPSTLVDNLNVDDRVWCQLVTRRIVVVGKGGGGGGGGGGPSTDGIRRGTTSLVFPTGNTGTNLRYTDVLFDSPMDGTPTVVVTPTDATFASVGLNFHITNQSATGFRLNGYRGGPATIGFNYIAVG